MTLKVDFSNLDRKITEISKELNREGARAIKEAAEQASQIIKTRTQLKGKDKDGKSFKEYSRSYSQFKQKTSSPNFVNLTSPGRRTKGGKGGLKGNAQGGTMINSLSVVEVNQNGLKRVITANNQFEQKKLEGHVRGLGDLPVRNPMGFTNKEDETITERIRRQMLAAIRKIGKR